MKNNHHEEIVMITLGIIAIILFFIAFKLATKEGNFQVNYTPNVPYTIGGEPIETPVLDMEGKG